MPNILINYNAKFNPLSYEELMKPIAYATEQQSAYEQAYEKMYDTADAIASQLSDDDVNSLSIYNNYNAKLQEAGKQLMEKGFNDPNVKKMLQDARRDFNNGMLKVGSAVEQRNKDLAARQNLMLAHPNIKVSPVGSVDEYLSKSNKPMTSVDLNTQYTKGINAGKGITSRMYSSPEFRNGMMLIKHGLASPNEVMNMLKGLTVTDENGNITDFNSEFQTAINSLMISSGMDNLSKEDQNAVTSSIMDGIIAGMIYDEKWSGIPSSGRSGGGGSRTSSPSAPINKSKFGISTRSSTGKNESQSEVDKTVRTATRHFKHRYKDNMLRVDDPAASPTDGTAPYVSVSFLDTNNRIMDWGHTKNSFLKEYDKTHPKPEKGKMDDRTYNRYVKRWEKNRDNFIRDAANTYTEFITELEKIGLHKGDAFSDAVLSNSLDKAKNTGTGIGVKMIATHWDDKLIKDEIMPTLRTNDNGETYEVYTLKSANKNGTVELETTSVPAKRLEGDNVKMTASYNPMQTDKYGNHLILIECSGGLKFYVRASSLNDQLENELTSFQNAFLGWNNPEIDIDYNTLYDMYNMSADEFESTKQFTDGQKANYRNALMEDDISTRAQNVHDLLYTVGTKSFTNSESLN